MRKTLSLVMLFLIFGQTAFAKPAHTRTRRVSRQDYGYSHTVRDHRRGVDYDYYEYEACYERPRQRIVEVHDQAKEDRGTGMVVFGILGAIGGQVVARDNRNLGNFISLASGMIAVAGAVEVSNSSEVFYEHNGYECRNYYEIDTRRYRFRNDRGYSCVTKRYYSQRWGSTHEYFETKCSGHTYVTFNRHRNVWGY